MSNNHDNDARREEFLTAAEKLFKQNGVVETTINAIVKEMDVAKGLFYYYFKSKDDVIEAISQKYNAMFEQALQRDMDRNNYDERLQQYIENVILSFRELWQNLHGEKENIDLSILASRSFDEAKQMASSVLTKLFEEGVENEKLDLQSPKHFADMMIGGIVDLIKQEDVNLEEIKQIIMDWIKKSRKEQL